MSYPLWRSKEDMVRHIEYLNSQLALSTEREERYRKALGSLLERIMETYGDCPSSVRRLAEEASIALSSSTAPEPVTVEEVEKVLGDLWKWLSEQEKTVLAQHLYSEFKMERKV